MLALEAAAAAGGDLIGVDLLPDGEGGWVVLELNGAVEWTREYSLDRDPFVAAAWELARVALGCPLGPAAPAALAAAADAGRGDVTRPCPREPRPTARRNPVPPLGCLLHSPSARRRSSVG